MPFFQYYQNNSGGKYILNEDVAINVIIEAADYKSANNYAKEIGIYFNGVSDGIDCECCGDRWDELNSYDDSHDNLDFYEFENIYLTDNFNENLKPEYIIYFLNGTKQFFCPPNLDL